MRSLYILAFFVFSSMLILSSCTQTEENPENINVTNISEDAYFMPESEIEFEINCLVQENVLCAAQAQTSDGWTIGYVKLSTVLEMTENKSFEKISSSDLFEEKLKEYGPEITKEVFDSSRKIIKLAESNYDDEYNMLKISPTYNDLDDAWIWQVSFYKESVNEPNEVFYIDFEGNEIIELE
ncbi:MAG: hypothetical protein PWQ87_242 [Candidatus Woesearchaeota archaeon]|nr:hypothetical protein [Candidatus Woesearchaeota archaeon]